MAKTRKKTKPSKGLKVGRPKSLKGITRFNSPIDEGDKARFHQHLPVVMAGRERVATATADLRNAYKAAKAHGFSKTDFDYAHDVETPERESAAKEGIRRRLLVAKWMGSDLGSQLDLFSEPTRVPAVDRAYEEGQTASMQNKAAKPNYAPATEAYAKYMAGYHDHQAAIVKAKASKTADKYTKPKVPKTQNGGGFGMDEEEFAAEQARAAPALTAHGLDEDEAP